MSGSNTEKDGVREGERKRGKEEGGRRGREGRKRE